MPLLGAWRAFKPLCLLGGPCPPGPVLDFSDTEHDTCSMDMSIWKCIQYYSRDLKLKRPRGVNLSELEIQVLVGVYTIFGTEHPRSWKCIILSELETQGHGSVLKDLEVYATFGAEYSRPWKRKLLSGLTTQGQLIVSQFRFSRCVIF